MPELPEVETVVNILRQQLLNDKITNVRVLFDKIIDNVEVSQFKESLVNQKFNDFKRLGKYIIAVLDDYYLIMHMRMEGKFYILDTNERYDFHTHVIFELDNKSLQYHDTRKFGKMYLYSINEDLYSLDCFKNVGLDAFDDKLDFNYLKSNIKNKKVSLKKFLLDQKYIAGIGNIYADEICFRLNLHPNTLVSMLSDEDINNILIYTRYILNGAIKAGGTTIKSYTSSLGVSGRFQLELKVHQRKGLECYNCGTIIEKITCGGRGTCYCPKCQILKNK